MNILNNYKIFADAILRQAYKDNAFDFFESPFGINLKTLCGIENKSEVKKGIRASKVYNEKTIGIGHFLRKYKNASVNAKFITKLCEEKKIEWFDMNENKKPYKQITFYKDDMQLLEYFIEKRLGIK